VIVTFVFDETPLVLTVNAAVVLLAGTVTLDGTVATEVLLLVSVTLAPPEGAAPVRVTVPVELLPPVTLVGFKVNEERVTLEEPGFTVKLADGAVPPDWAKMGTTSFVVVLKVPIEKLRLVLPAGTVTTTGSCTGGLGSAGLQLAQNWTKTSLPPEGAAAVRVTVAVVLLPPVTLVGFRLIDLTAMPVVTVTEPCAVLFPSVAVAVTTVLLRTNRLFAVAWKSAVVAPPGTLTLPGRVGKTEGLSEDSPTTEPPDGAGPLNVTVPTDVPPFGMLEGLKVSDETLGPHPDPVFGVSS
jgi:hypothetical protein